MIMDMEAGIEHLGRATAQSMEALIIVVDGGPWSIQTALRVRKLANDLGMTRLFAVMNRVDESTDVAQAENDLDGIPLIGQIPYDRRVLAGLTKTNDAGEIEPNEWLAEKLPLLDTILSKIQDA